MEIEINGNGINTNIIGRKENVGIIQQVCSDFFGQRMEIAFDTTVEKQEDIQGQKEQAEQTRQEALNHPRVAEAIEVFSGRVVEVKPL